MICAVKKLLRRECDSSHIFFEMNFGWSFPSTGDHRSILPSLRKIVTYSVTLLSGFPMAHLTGNSVYVDTMIEVFTDPSAMVSIHQPSSRRWEGSRVHTDAF